MFDWFQQAADSSSSPYASQYASSTPSTTAGTSIQDLWQNVTNPSGDVAVDRSSYTQPRAAKAPANFALEQQASVSLSQVLQEARLADGSSRFFEPMLSRGGIDAGVVRSLHERLKLIIQGMSERLIDRDESIRVMLLAAVCGQHVLLFGPPGTAKSAMAHLLRDFVSDSAKAKAHGGGGGSYFEAHFHASTTMEDIFGPLSLKDLEQGRLRRKVESMLPCATIAFLDEAFKAQPSLLSSLLSTLNERIFKNGDTMLEDLPLQFAMVASNEVPRDAGAGALVDRLLLRSFVDYVADGGERKKGEPDDGKDNAQNKIMNSKFQQHSDDIVPLVSMADFAALREYAKANLRYPADKLETRATWSRNLEEYLVLFSKDQARTLVDTGYLTSSWTSGIQVAKDAVNPGEDDDGSTIAPFEFQELKAGWTLVGYSNLDELREALCLSDEEKGWNRYPFVLTFHGQRETVKVYDLVRDFVKIVREMDEQEEIVNSSRRLTVEGGGRLSDRRLKQVVDVLRIVAISNNRKTLTVPDLFIMAYCCWKSKKDWLHISSFWLERLKQEMRSMAKEDKSQHSARDNIWLSDKIKAELQKAGDGEGLTMTEERRDQISTVKRLRLRTIGLWDLMVSWRTGRMSIAASRSTMTLHSPRLCTRARPSSSSYSRKPILQ
eukprot:TRINITY_DN14358_c0_g1_i1.p1 TRINITY_DN14358_c0_g1~~TRINITY_DN14358_c0_g1_i1.p1  ORF type:complete len:664 (-),score=117.54 TRINITY_DN14358_c0_g1_i1:483-2474(-)